MKVLVVISAVLAVASATGAGFAYSTAVPYLNGLAYNGLVSNVHGYNGILPYAGYHGYSSAVLPYAAHHVAAPYTAHHLAATYAAHHVAAPIVAPVAYNALATKSQYHAQDELGQASFGHATHDQTHTAFRNALGGVTGHYSYINPEGKIVEASYVADSLGYRVASNDLPVAPAVPAVPDLVGPTPVLLTLRPRAVNADRPSFPSPTTASTPTPTPFLTPPMPCPTPPTPSVPPPSPPSSTTPDTPSPTALTNNSQLRDIPELME
ncbi:hypothetical protein J437_LFUL017510 [Ladona fulva]|uniref:Cuticle protein n=1 Tax=Ladona fulva TaxID=123851 RepID=A0A8K0KMX3_LADFU|nr:hypothetical protein J437_LFUL017510 [Ladona fulva]